MFDGMLSPVSNRADWIDCVEVLDSETDEPIDLSTLQDIVLAIRFPGGGYIADGYTSSPGNYYGVTASLKTGEIRIVQPGIFEFWFKASQMAALPPQTYNLGLIMVTQDGVTNQVIIGAVPVLEGFATAGVVVT